MNLGVGNWRPGPTGCIGPILSLAFALVLVVGCGAPPEHGAAEIDQLSLMIRARSGLGFEVRPPSAEGAQSLLVRANVGSEVRDALVATPRSEIRFSLTVPAAASLVLGMGVDGGGPAAGGTGVLFSVGVQRVETPCQEGTRTAGLGQDQAPELLVEQRITASGDWHDLRLPLHAFAGEEVTLILRTDFAQTDASQQAGLEQYERGGEGQVAGDHREHLAYWSLLRLATRRSQQSRPDIFLITVDTLRADHLRSFGYHRDTSPAIDGLARDGVLFERAYTTVPRTGPAFASLFTGHYPAAHRVYSMLDALPPGQWTMAERLRIAGYRTAADATLNVPWSKSFDQGFERYDDRNDDSLARGSGLVDGAVDWLQQQDGSRPLFQWLHLWDPHLSYQAPEPWRDHFDPDFDGVFDLYERVRKGQRTWGQVYFQNDLNARQVEHAIALYDGEILYTDRMIQRFLDALRLAGRYDDALIVFASDHGESLGEHDFYFEHGEYLYDNTLRIPLIVKFPGGWGAGQRIRSPASILDLLPTVLSIAGEEVGELEGVDLRQLAENDNGGSRLLFAQTGSSFVPENPRRDIDGVAGYWTSIRQRELKLIHIPTREGVSYELYDLESDPGETRNLYRMGDPRGERLAEALRRWRELLLASEQAAPEKPGMDAQDLERLRSLGYIN